MPVEKSIVRLFIDAFGILSAMGALVSYGVHYYHLSKIIPQPANLIDFSDVLNGGMYFLYFSAGTFLLLVLAGAIFVVLPFVIAPRLRMLLEAKRYLGGVFSLMIFMLMLTLLWGHYPAYAYIFKIALVIISTMILPVVAAIYWNDVEALTFKRMLDSRERSAVLKMLLGQTLALAATIAAIISFWTFPFFPSKIALDDKQSGCKGGAEVLWFGQSTIIYRCGPQTVAAANSGRVNASPGTIRILRNPENVVLKGN